jgi:hypothetical protein
MTRRKDELSANRIGRERPEQVAQLSAIRSRATTTISSANYAVGFRSVRAGTRCGGTMSRTAFSVSPVPRTLSGFAKGSAASTSIRRIAVAQRVVHVQ